MWPTGSRKPLSPAGGGEAERGDDDAAPSMVAVSPSPRACEATPAPLLPQRSGEKRPPPERARRATNPACACLARLARLRRRRCTLPQPAATDGDSDGYGAAALWQRARRGCSARPAAGARCVLAGASWHDVTYLRQRHATPLMVC
jgi:hypothetical protein